VQLYFSSSVAFIVFLTCFYVVFTVHVLLVIADGLRAFIVVAALRAIYVPSRFFLSRLFGFFLVRRVVFIGHAPCTRMLVRPFQTCVGYYVSA